MRKYINTEKGRYSDAYLELDMAHVNDIYEKIVVMCIAFDVDYVTDDVYNALVEDYVMKNKNGDL